MITQLVYLKDYDWLIKIFKEVSHKELEGIIPELISVDCKDFTKAWINSILEDSESTFNFSASKSSLHVSFIVIGKLKTSKLLKEVLTLEIKNIAETIATYYDISPYKKEFKYLCNTLKKEIKPTRK